MNLPTRPATTGSNAFDINELERTEKQYFRNSSAIFVKDFLGILLLKTNSVVFHFNQVVRFSISNYNICFNVN
ncbi:MAG: hypothetical protein JWR72_54 [Flavisolibacter sp.]|nr:hypothetical protein [Flavisolibacter sp.]